MPATAPPEPSANSTWRKWIVPVAGGGILSILIVSLITLNDGSQTDDLFEIDDYPPVLIEIPGGTFVMGTDTGPDDQRPAHSVTLKGFRIGKTEVTNGQYAAFVKATGYLTVAERTPDQTKFPGAVAGSAVFRAVDAPLQGPWNTPHPPWWEYVPGANWRHPDGKGNSIQGKKDYPVVQIAWDDAMAYCQWAGVRLPTEAEWEYAARGGLVGQEHCWGSAKQGESGVWRANTHQGDFPRLDTGEDGFKGVAPVARYPANGYGLHDMSGNVWEWCADFYDSRYYAASPANNPQGPEVGEADNGQPQRVRRGGSYLCDDRYCRRYVPAARDKNPADSGASHTGFRIVKDR